jgi:hypothetical protein
MYFCGYEFGVQTVFEGLQTDRIRRTTTVSKAYEPYSEE